MVEKQTPTSMQVHSNFLLFQPTNVTKAWSFLGMACYYRRFVKEFPKLALPINKLIRKSNKCEWSEECENNL